MILSMQIGKNFASKFIFRADAASDHKISSQSSRKSNNWIVPDSNPDDSNNDS